MSLSLKLLRRLSVDRAMVKRQLPVEVVSKAYSAVQVYNPFRCAELLANGTVKVDGVKWVERHSSVRLVGTLYITATHVIFVDTGGKKEIWILLSHIGNVDKLPSNAAGSTLQIQCKNFQNLTFIIPRERDSHDVYLSLQQLSQPGLDDLYCFHYNHLDLGEKASGWDLVDIEADYRRMGIPNDSWIVSDINKNYEICDTYPRWLYVPRSASKHILLGSARFRSRGRLPVLTYYRQHNQAALCRGSQPLAGFSARCEEDEKLLQTIRKTNSGSQFMYVVDTRPKINAMMNRASGKGYENESFYADIKFQFMGIENIHVMRASIQKLLEVCDMKNPTMSAFLSGLEASGWLGHIRAIIDTSAFIAKALVDGVSVLAHCSDGWDRTAQTCALALVLIDPHYRTCDGFQVLVEKEWVLFGHKFIDRCGFVGGVDQKETSPIFTQFVDSVWQIMQQFPAAFEFNERFLLTIHDHVYSCQFGTFVSNCEKDRVDLRLRERTFSLWAYLRKNKRQFINPFYKEFEPSDGILIPNIQPQNIKFWCGMYCRFDNNVQPRENIEDVVARVKNHTISLEDHVMWLTDRVSSLCGILGKSDELLNKALMSLSASDSMDFSKVLLGTSSARKERVKDADNKELTDSLDSNIQSDGVLNHKDEMISSVNVEDSGSSSADDKESLMSSSLVKSKTESQTLHFELQSVATHWTSVKSSPLCLCGTAFDSQMSRNYCWRCGQSFCLRCISDEEVVLQGHHSQQPVPVCKNCRKILTKALTSSSVDDLKLLQRQLQHSTSSSNLS